VILPSAADELRSPSRGNDRGQFGGNALRQKPRQLEGQSCTADYEVSTCIGSDAHQFIIILKGHHDIYAYDTARRLFFGKGYLLCQGGAGCAHGVLLPMGFCDAYHDSGYNPDTSGTGHGGRQSCHGDTYAHAALYYGNRHGEIADFKGRHGIVLNSYGLLIHILLIFFQ
jgi:hypothetical protein